MIYMDSLSLEAWQKVGSGKEKYEKQFKFRFRMSLTYLCDTLEEIQSGFLGDVDPKKKCFSIFIHLYFSADGLHSHK